MDRSHEYIGKKASGTTWYDKVSGTNGTLYGSSYPGIVINGRFGHLTFSGGNGSTPGNYNRVLFGADWEWGGGNNFSIGVMFRTSRSDSVYDSILTNRDSGVTGFWCFDSLTDYTTKMNLNEASLNNNKLGTGSHANNDGIWHLALNSYATGSGGTAIYMLDGTIIALSTDDTMSTNDFHSPNSKCLAGCRWSNSDSNYVYDLTGDIAVVLSWEKALSIGEMKTLTQHYLRGLNGNR